MLMTTEAVGPRPGAAGAGAVRGFVRGVVPGRAGWSLALSGGRSRILEVVNRVLALALDVGRAADVAEEFDALAACRLAGGAWGETTCEEAENLYNTCLAGSNLLRAGTALGRPDLTAEGRDAAALVAARQGVDGTWSDPGWSAWEVTAAALVLLADAGGRTGVERAAVARGLAAVAGAQGPDGLWPSPSAWDAPFGTTARLLSALVRHGKAGAPAAHAAASALAASATGEGTWGLGQTETTAAVVGALAEYAAAGGRAQCLAASVARSLAWVESQGRADGRWPEFPGGPSGILPTCAALACLARAGGHSPR